MRRRGAQRRADTHGTGGTGRGFLTDGYAGRLFGKGQLLDAERYFIILPDNVGHGGSSKPSDGLRMHFEVSLHRYGEAAARAGDSGPGPFSAAPGDRHVDGSDAHVDVGLHVPRVRRRARTVGRAKSRGEIAGRNRVWRKALVDAIVTDPEWNGGTRPRRRRAHGELAIGFLLMATSVPMQWQRQFPTAEAADKYLASQIASRMKSSDANDMIYYFRASEDYNPEPYLEKITRPLLAINSADDFVNPPKLPMMQDPHKRVKHGRFVLVPISDLDERGHGSHRCRRLRSELQTFLGAK